MIKIICIGSIKKDYLKKAILDYKTRIEKYHKIKIIELPNIVDKNPQNILLKEKELILKNIDCKDYIISLQIDGKKITSGELANKINNIFVNYRNITFIIGGSYGLDSEVINKSNFQLSFSSLTFPHQLFRVILLEQIYRSFKILNNESYHK